MFRSHKYPTRLTLDYVALYRACASASLPIMHHPVRTNEEQLSEIEVSPDLQYIVKNLPACLKILKICNKKPYIMNFV